MDLNCSMGKGQSRIFFLGGGDFWSWGGGGDFWSSGGGGGGGGDIPPL